MFASSYKRGITVTDQDSIQMVVAPCSVAALIGCAFGIVVVVVVDVDFRLPLLFVVVRPVDLLSAAVCSVGSGGGPADLPVRVRRGAWTRALAGGRVARARFD